MRSSFTVTTGLKLSPSPNARKQSARRRAVIVCAVLGLAAASGVVGALSARHGANLPAAGTGPFSYFPS